MYGETISPYTTKNGIDATAAIREGGVLISVTPEDYHKWREEVDSATKKAVTEKVSGEFVLEE